MHELFMAHPKKTVEQMAQRVVKKNWDDESAGPYTKSKGVKYVRKIMGIFKNAGVAE